MGSYETSKLPKPTRDLEQVKRDVGEWGYGIILDLLSAEENRRLLDRLDEQARLEREQGVAWLGTGGRGGNTWIGAPHEGDAAPWQGVRTLLNKGRPFIDLAMNAKVLECMRHVFGGLDFYLSSTNGLIIRKGAVPMMVHTDLIFVPVVLPIPFAANVMVTLTDFTEANGATRVVPGSHRLPPPKFAIDPEKLDGYNPEPIESVAAECPARCGIVFEGRLWHSSGASTSDDVRYSISTYYSLPFMRQQDAYTASLQDDVYESLTDEERAMFGFKAVPLGRLDPRFPGDRTNTDVRNPFIPELRSGSEKRAVPVGEQKFFSVGGKGDRVLLNQEPPTDG